MSCGESYGLFNAFLIFWEGLLTPCIQGTGSKPPGFSGWQRLIRFTPNQLPLTMPYFSMA